MRLYEDMAYGPEPIANSYWESTVERPPVRVLEDSVSCDTVVIGAGYTGLNAALELAGAGQDVVVLDANYPGWGASGRNGGFCCIGGAKTNLKSLTRAHGRDAALTYLRAEQSAVGFVADRLDMLGIDADTHSEGETLLAHSSRAALAMQASVAEDAALYGVASEYLPREALAEHGFESPAFHGALTTPVGFALNPIKYVLGLARTVEASGARVYGQSAVVSMSKDASGGHLLRTAKGELRATSVLVATNGYSSEDLPQWLGGRFLPVQSSIFVTRPINDNELKAQGWTTRQMCYDSRHLLHYFRLLPDNRMLFGLRGGSRTTPKHETETHAQARRDFERMFPAWSYIEAEYAWSGLVCMARDLTPFAGPVPGLDGVWAALCYHGNGVAMASYTGAMVAGQILGRANKTPSVMSRRLRRFELGRQRRALLPLASAWYKIQDRLG